LLLFGNRRFQGRRALLRSILGVRSLENWPRTVANQSKPGPVYWQSLIAELLKKIQFCCPERSTFVVAVNQMLIKPFHESNRVRIVGGPKARDYGSCTSQQECTFQAGDSFLSAQSSIACIARRERHKVSVECKVSDLSNLQQTVVRRIGRASQNQRCSIGKLRAASAAPPAETVHAHR
jgi:hypothetical protein